MRCLSLAVALGSLAACRSSTVTPEPAQHTGDAPDDTARDTDSGGDSDTVGDGPTDADGDGVPGDEDCDDLDATVHPGAVEVCNGQDDDCDGAVDAGASDAGAWHADQDGDGFGDPLVVITACAPPPGWVGEGTDCDDHAPDLHPGASETCDGRDEDCDGAIDEEAADATASYVDADGDGFGASATESWSCEHGGDRVEEGGDCDDANPEIRPGAVEICGDHIDQDCAASPPCRLVGVSDLEDLGEGLATLSPGREGYTNGLSYIGDIDGDGRDEILFGGGVASDAGGCVRMEMVRGAARSTGGAPALVAEPFYAPKGLILGVAHGRGDVDGDGQLDAVLLSHFGPSGTPIPDIAVVPIVTAALCETSRITASVQGTAWSSPVFPSPAVVLLPTGDGLAAHLAVTLLEKQEAHLFRHPVAGEYTSSDAELVVGGVDYDPIARGPDIDGDGGADLLFSSRAAHTPCVMSAARSGRIDVADADVCIPQAAGWVGDAIDFDGDGYEEIPLNTGTDTSPGQARVFALPAAGGVPSEIVRAVGVSRGVAAATDFDGDGRGDVLIHGEYYAEIPLYPGERPDEVRVLYGGSLGVVDAADMATYRSFVVSWGAPGVYSPRALDGQGDFDGDGYSDIAAWSFYADDGGGAWLVFGAGD